jgi:hypothetical protein
MKRYVLLIRFVPLSRLAQRSFSADDRRQTY